MIRNLLFSTAATLALALAGPALAQNGDGSTSLTDQLETDQPAAMGTRDGAITRDRVDTSGDGSTSLTDQMPRSNDAGDHGMRDREQMSDRGMMRRNGNEAVESGGDGSTSLTDQLE